MPFPVETLREISPAGPRRQYVLVKVAIYYAAQAEGTTGLSHTGLPDNLDQTA